MMRPFDYARTPPAAPEAFLVVAVRLVVVIMVRTYAAGHGRRQRPWRQNRPFGPLNEVEQDGLVTP
jgi:hypothetical protein